MGGMLLAVIPEAETDELRGGNRRPLGFRPSGLFRREGGSLPGILPRPPDELCRSAWACLLNRAGPPSGGANGRESIEFLAGAV